jgi:hypothetical protein
MTCAIVIHNLVIEVDGPISGGEFADLHTRVEELEDRGAQDIPQDENLFETGEQKRNHLIDELLAFRQLRDSKED